MKDQQDQPPVTRRALAHATFDFLDGTIRTLKQLAEYSGYIMELNGGNLPLGTVLMAQEITTQAVQTANETLRALGGVAVFVGEQNDWATHNTVVRIHAVRQLTPPEGPPTWLVSNRQGHMGELTLGFAAAREQLQE